MTKEYEFIQISQNGIDFFLVSIDSITLSKICKTSISNIRYTNSTDTYQRTLNPYRVRQISSFVQRQKGIMPTAVVLNSLNDLVFKNNKIVIDDEKDQFFIIDGQHRIAGVNEAQKTNFFFPVIIMNCVETSFQDELFVSINNEQKRVNPTIRFRLKANSYAMTPEKAVLKIAMFLNDDVDSAFYGLIKMDDKPYSKKTAMLSLSTFAQVILSYIYNDNDYYQIKDILLTNKCVDRVNGKLNDFSRKYHDRFLWPFYRTDNYELIGKILFNYFNALKKALPASWGNKQYITTKTTGYNALMLLFKDVFYHCHKNNRNFSFSFMFDLLSCINSLDKDLTQQNFGLGKVASLFLYKELYAKVFKTDSSPIAYDDLNRLLDDSDE